MVDMDSGFGKGIRMACFHLHNHNEIPVAGNDVDLLMPPSPVAFDYPIALVLEEGNGNFLPGFSQFYVFFHFRVECKDIISK